MKILVTGPTGFIGGATLSNLLAAGHQVAALVQPGEQLANATARHPNLTRLTGSLADAPWESIHSFAPGACLHTAWITTPGQYWESTENDRFVEWSVAFAKGFFQTGGRYFLGVGSCAEYRPSPEPLAEETDKFNPSTRYARCKLAFRRELFSLARQHEADAGWARVFYPYGIGERPERLCTTLIRQLADGRPVQLMTPNSVKDYIYIDDLASGLQQVLRAGVAGDINLGTGIPVTVRQLAMTIAEMLHRTTRIEETDQSTPDPLDHMVADVTRLQSLGWCQTTPLRDGLHRLIEHLTR